MLDEPHGVQASCNVCREFRPVDLVRVASFKGRDYSLINKRTRCTFTPGCGGWVRFHFRHGVMRPLWDNKTAMRWIKEDDLVAEIKRVTAERCASRRPR